MITRNLEEIVINGVRYNLSIRLETPWSYPAEWWNAVSHGEAADDRVVVDSDAERRASDAIEKARLTKEPWLCAEIARAEGEEMMLTSEHPD